MSSASWANALHEQNQAQYQAAMQLKQAGNHAQAEQALAEFVQKEPNNVVAQTQLAIVQSWQNKFELALENFQRALAIDPSYLDARVGLARVSYWQGDRTRALAEMEIVLKTEATVADHWILQGDIQMADAQPQAARESYLKAQHLLGNQASAELQQKIEQAKAPKQWRLDAGYISDTYSSERVDGNSSYLQMGYTFANRTTLYVRGENYSSFDQTDSGLVYGTYFSPHQTLLIHGEYYKNSDRANNRPEAQTTVNTEFLLSDTWQPLLGYRNASYDLENDGDEADVETYTPGLRLNLADVAVEYRHARTSNIDKTTTATNSFKLSINGESISPYFVFTQGEEGIPPLDVADVTVFGVGAVVKLNESLGFRVDYSREDRKSSYVHDAFGAGLSVFF